MVRSQDIDIFIMKCEVERTLSFICPPAILRAGFADQVATQHDSSPNCIACAIRIRRNNALSWRLRVPFRRFT